MYCSNCGVKIPEKSKSKFCSKCGEPLEAKLTKSPETPPPAPTPTVTPPKPKKGNPIALLIVGIILVFFFSYIFDAAGTAQSSSYSAFFAVIGIILSICLAVWLVILLVKFIIKKPLIGLITTGIIIVIIAAPALYYMLTVHKVAMQSFDALQNSSTELYDLRALGDDVWAGRNVPSGTSMKGISERAKTVSTQIDGLTVDSNFTGYKTALKNWADQINQAADKGTWSTLAAVPTSFTSGISQADAETYFEKSMDQVINLKSYSDWIIYVNDHQAMRYVTAGLQTQDYFLDGIMSNLKSASAVSFNLVEPALATHYTPVCHVTRNKAGAIITNDCWDRAKQEIPKLIKDSRGYTIGDPSAPESLTGDWNNLGQSIDLSETTPIGGAGITNGEPATPPQNSPMVEDFFNECRAKGGNTSPASLVKTRMPTTEGGHDCAYGNGCWDTLTYSGRRFMGGNPGCPEEGLVPVAPVIPNPIPNIIPTPNPTPTPTSYDGTYSVRYSYGNCGTNVPGVNLGNLGVFTDTLTVRNNTVTWSGQSAKIDSSGRATWSMNISGVGYIQQVFNFTKSGVSGTFNFQISTQGYSQYVANVSCNGSFSGSKN